MSPSEVVWQVLERSCPTAPVVLLDDFFNLLELSEAVAWKPSQGRLFVPLHTQQVLTAWGNLGFRLAYEPLRERQTPVIIVRKRPEVFLPDVEARLQSPEHHLRITPQWLLQQATGDEEWPAVVDNYFTLLPAQWDSWLQAHARFRRRKPQGFSESDLNDLLISAWLDLDLAGQMDPVTVWQRFFSTGEAQREMQQRFPRLWDRWLSWLSTQPAPVCWLAEGSGENVGHLIGWFYLLAPHVEDPVAFLSRVYPGMRWRQGLSVDRVERFVASLEKQFPRLAQAQVDEAEEALMPGLFEGVLSQLGLEEVTAARELARREQRSPRLLIAALRQMIFHLAQHPEDLHSPEWREGVVRWQERSAAWERRRSGPALAKHVRLFNTLITLHQSRQQVQNLLARLPHVPPSFLPKVLVSAYVEARVYTIPSTLEELQTLLLEDDINDPRFSPQEGPEALRGLAIRLWEWGQEVARLRGELEAFFLRAAAQNYPGWLEDPAIPWLSRFWVRTFHPLWQERGKPPVALFLCHGLGWDLWERVLRPGLEETFLVRCQPWVVPLPALPALILPRWLAGEEWQPADLQMDPVALAQRSVPGQTFAKARWPHPADEEEGIVGQHWVSEEITITEIHFCTSTGQLRPEVAAALTQERAARRLAARLRALLDTVPREALIFLVSGGGFVVPHRRIAWDPPPGTRFLAPRCAVGGGEDVPAEAVAFTASELGLPPTVLDKGVSEGKIPADPLFMLAPREHCFAGAMPAEGAADRPPSSGARRAGVGGACGGGLSLDEWIVPGAVLLPRPPVRGVEIDLSSPVVAEEYLAGQPGELSIVLHLRSGALAEVAFVACDVPGAVPAVVGLEVGVRKPVRLGFVPLLEPGPEAVVELPVQVTVKVAGEEYRRIARIRVRRQT